MKNNKGFATQSVLLVLLVIALVAIGYLVGKKDSLAPTKSDELNSSMVVDENQNNITQENNVQTNTQNNQLKYSTTLPQYIGGQEGWPPVVKDSSKSYACDNLGQAPVGEVQVQKVINGRTYCVVSTVEAAAGSRYGVYLYVTANGVGTKSTQFTLKWPSCGVYGGPTDPTYKECQSQQDTFFANLDNLIDSLM